MFDIDLCMLNYRFLFIVQINIICQTLLYNESTNIAYLVCDRLIMRQNVFYFFELNILIIVSDHSNRLNVYELV